MADFSWIKEHPYEAGGAILGGGIILYLIFTSGSSASTASATTGAVATGGPTYAAQPDDTALGINAQLTQAQLQAGLQSQLSTDAVTLGSLQSNNQTQVALAQTSDALQAVQSDNATQLGLYNGYFQNALQLAQLRASAPTPVASVNPSNPTTLPATPQPPAQISVANPYPSGTSYNVSGTPLLGAPPQITGTAPYYGQSVASGYQNPTYIQPSQCSPLDSACVNRNAEIENENIGTYNQSISGYDASLNASNLALNNAQRQSLGLPLLTLQNLYG